MFCSKATLHPVALPACNYYLSLGSLIALTITTTLAALQTLANSIEHDLVPS
jgi:hypothetical protein